MNISVSSPRKENSLLKFNQIQLYDNLLSLIDKGIMLNEKVKDALKNFFNRPVCFNLAQAIVEMEHFKKKIIYCEGIFYIKKNNLWKEIIDIKVLRSMISGYIEKVLKHFDDALVEDDMDEKHLKLKVRQEYIRLTSPTNITSTMEALTRLVDNENIIELLDSDWSVIPFKNGIFDLKMKVFREYNDTDFFSVSCPVEYNI